MAEREDANYPDLLADLRSLNLSQVTWSAPRPGELGEMDIPSWVFDPKVTDQLRTAAEQAYRAAWEAYRNAALSLAAAVNVWEQMNSRETLVKE